MADAVQCLPRVSFCLQSAEYRFLSSLNVLNVVQSGIMFMGISLGVIACTAGVAKVCAVDMLRVQSESEQQSEPLLSPCSRVQTLHTCVGISCKCAVSNINRSKVWLSSRKNASAPVAIVHGVNRIAFCCGRANCCCAYVQGALTVGDTVLFLTLMAQLYGPLSKWTVPSNQAAFGHIVVR